MKNLHKIVKLLCSLEILQQHESCLVSFELECVARA